MKEVGSMIPIAIGKENENLLQECNVRFAKGGFQIYLLKKIYAVFVRNLNFLGNKSSTVKISSMLMAVVEMTLIIKSRKLPKLSH